MFAGLLEIGLSGALHVREEHLSTRHDACRLLYVSDIHLRRSRSDSLCGQVISSAYDSEPYAVLLGGDLVDELTELDKLRDLVSALRRVAPVLAVGGNHDSQVGMDRVRDAVVGSGGTWIHDCTTRLTHGPRVIAVAGPDAVAVPEGDYRVL